MSRLSSAIARHPLLAFFLLAFGLSWGVWLLQAPLLFYPPGPFLAAIIVTAATEGRTGVKALLSRLVRWRVGRRWYAVALGAIPALILAAVALNVLLGAPAPTAAQLALLPGVLLALPVILLTDGAWEELGWRGYALPRLQAARSPLAASVILGVVWAAWHLPIMITNMTVRQAPWAGNLAWAVWLIPGAIFLTWLYNNTKGSVLLTTLAHAAQNAVGGAFAFQLFAGADMVRLFWLVAALSWVLALGLVLLTGRNLSRSAVAPPSGTPVPVAGI